MAGDKSLSHRARILGAMAEGQTILTGLSESRGVRSTLRCLRALGATPEEVPAAVDELPLLAVAALSAADPTRLLGAGFSDVSFPGFWDLLPEHR